MMKCSVLWAEAFFLSFFFFGFESVVFCWARKRILIWSSDQKKSFDVVQCVHELQRCGFGEEEQRRGTKNKEQQQWWDWKDWNSSSSDNSTPSSQILSVTTSSSSVSFVPSSSPLLHSPLCPSSIDEIKTLKLSRVCSNIRFAFFLILLKGFLNKSCMEDRTEKRNKTKQRKLCHLSL